MKTHTSTSCILLSLMVLGLTGCGPDNNTETAEAVSAAGAQPVSGSSFLLTNAPASAPGLNEGLEANAEGETFLVSGRVGGLVDPISEGFAGFVLADESLVFCDEMSEKGHCPTPWDACCEDPDKILASRAFVQFADDAGMPLSVDLREAIGLAENDTVIVKGKLAPESTAENRIILAEGLAIVR